MWFVVLLFVIYNSYITLETQQTYVRSKNVDFTKRNTGVCNFNTVDLPIPGTECCLLDNGDETGLRRIKVNGLDAQISEAPVFYITACKGLCPGGVGKAGFCVDEDGNKDEKSDSYYQKCLTSLDPGGCKKSANPVARQGNTLFYVKRFGKINCDKTKVC